MTTTLWIIGVLVFLTLFHSYSDKIVPPSGNKYEDPDEFVAKALWHAAIVLWPVTVLPVGAVALGKWLRTRRQKSIEETS